MKCNDNHLFIPYIGKSKELDYVREISTWGGKWFKSSTKLYRANQYGQYDLL